MRAEVAAVTAFLLLGGSIFAAPATAAPRPITLGEAMKIYEVYSKMIEPVKKGIELTRKGLEAAKASHKPLTPADEAVWEAIGNDPAIPFRCARDAECRPCYEKAYEKFRRYRFKLAKARAIVLNASQYHEAMVAFGDNLSSGLGAAGLGWAFARPKVEREWKKLQQVYQRKVQEFLAEVDDALLDMSFCEADVYGDTDWYQRFGRLYLDFLRTTYVTIPK